MGRLGAPCRRQPVLSRESGLARFRTVVGQPFGPAFGDVRKPLLNYVRDPAMQHLTSALEQRGVGGLLNQRMAEPVGG